MIFKIHKIIFWKGLLVGLGYSTLDGGPESQKGAWGAPSWRLLRAYFAVTRCTAETPHPTV